MQYHAARSVYRRSVLRVRSERPALTSDNACADVVGKYLSILSKDFAVSPVEGGCHVTTPFTRPDGEAIEFEITTLPGARTRLADMGDTLGYLYVNGLTLTRGVLKKATDIARGYGVSVERNMLVVEIHSEVAGEELHRLIQATLAVTHLVQGRRASGRVVFDDEVESFIIQTGVTYDSDYQVRGLREGHTFKFHVNSGAHLLIQPLSAAGESAAHTIAERWAYRCMDVVQGNEPLRPVVLLDDRNTRSDIWTLEAQAPVNGFAILWGDKEHLGEMLVATAS